MPSTRSKKDKFRGTNYDMSKPHIIIVPKCQMCPATFQPYSNNGRMHKGKWFCSWSCIQEYEQELNEESPMWIDDPIK